LKAFAIDRAALDVLAVPERNPHRTRANFAIAERNLIIAEFQIETTNKHHSLIDHVFDVALRPAAVVQTGKCPTTLTGFFGYVLRYVA
jgi:hypothetical protein